MDTSNDGLEMRCPRLGGTISFQYCRTSGDEGMPCLKTADCWWEAFDVITYLWDNLTKEQFQQLVEKKEVPQPKVSSLLDLIEQARNRV